MNIIGELQELLAPIGLYVAECVYEGTPQLDGTKIIERRFLLLTPLHEGYPDIADDAPLTESAQADINIYSPDNYLSIKEKVIRLLNDSEFSVVDRQYINYEENTHHYVITVEKKVIYEEVKHGKE